ncbi:hypothetical protein QAD02_022151 [Eretmocerus hayati]|uniref:Uncharacterized protein n=1 Tax=Eretmocerus hayati TaxID=131215 RepID=A0ACC2PSH4_9HYME|nr:hypothetical protein QAD02_022151 [Eretmocerus hayati]
MAMTGELETWSENQNVVEENLKKQRAQFATEKEKFMKTTASEQALLMRMTFEELQRRGAGPAQCENQVRTSMALPHASGPAPRTALERVSEFKPKDDWTIWIERLEQYFGASDIPEQKKVSILLLMINCESYLLLQSFCFPYEPKTQTYQTLVEKMGNQVQPKRKVISVRFHFKQCCQRENETIKDYCARLKEKSTCYKFVWRVRDEATQRELLSEEDDLTVVKAAELADSLETARKDVTRMHVNQKKTGNNELNNIKKNRSLRDTDDRETDDTGALRTFMPKEVIQNLGFLTMFEVKETSHNFNDYIGTKMKPIGYINVDVEYEKVKKHL